MREISDLLIANTFKNINHQSKLKELLSSASLVEIICPFISNDGADWLLENRKKDAKIKIITELSVKGVISGVQSTIALKKLLDAGCEIYYMTSELHAKVYWFDQKESVITSANLTSNGLKNNLEIGFAVSAGIFHESFVRGGTKAFNDNLRALFDFVKRQTGQLTNDILEKYGHLKDESADLREKLAEMDRKFLQSFNEIPYTPNQRICSNSQNIRNELLLTNMFNGFEVSDWDVFNNSLELNEDNRNKFRSELSKRINPLLSVFFKQLKYEPVFSKTYNNLQMGFSQNRLLTTRFPHDRYLFLTKPRAGKLAFKHLGEPSIIIGMGKKENDSGWLEVRAGVEEDTLQTGLSDAGAKLIQRMLNNSSEVIAILQGLGSGWYLTHGSYSRSQDVELDVKTLTGDILKSEISHYLQTKEISDLQIRRKYYLNKKEDAEILLSPKITSVIAKDVERISYFFDLAQ
jgi:HKD family nuclease